MATRCSSLTSPAPAGDPGAAVSPAGGRARAGAGRTFHDSVQGVTFQGGLGLRLYLMKRLSFRLDVRDFIMPQEVLGRGRTTHNITLLAGFGIWLG